MEYGCLSSFHENKSESRCPLPWGKYLFSLLTCFLMHFTWQICTLHSELVDSFGTLKPNYDTILKTDTLHILTPLSVQNKWFALNSLTCVSGCVHAFVRVSCPAVKPATAVSWGETSAALQAQPRLHNEDILRDGLCLPSGCQGVLHTQAIRKGIICFGCGRRL